MRTCSLAGLVAEPLGARIRGPHFTYCWPASTLSICVAVGPFETEDLRAVLPLFEAIRSLPPHRALWDLSRVDAVANDAFVQLQTFLRQHFRTKSSVERVAVVAPPQGPLRAVAAGMFAFLEPRYAVEAFGSSREALAWLEADRRLADVVDAEAALIVEAAFTDVVASWLDAHLVDADPRACARDLGVSLRTLQRRLGERKTSFGLEANRARVRAAERLLAGETPVTTIALRVGFSSAQHFATVFRRLTGKSPSAVRARKRVALRDT